MQLCQHFNITDFSVFWQTVQICSFFHHFSLFTSFRMQGRANFLKGLIINYWKFFLPFFASVFTSPILAIFFVKFEVFKIYKTYCHYLSFARARKSPIAFEHREIKILLAIGCLSLFIITNFSKIDKICNLFSFFFEFFKGKLTCCSVL